VAWVSKGTWSPVNPAPDGEYYFKDPELGWMVISKHYGQHVLKDLVYRRLTAKRIDVHYGAWE
jgi:hypothetical protein